MSDINNVIEVGNFTADPELRHTQSGTPVCSFTIANNRTWTNDGQKQQDTSFFNCVAWGKTGETINQYCRKGERIGIMGRLAQRTWQDKDTGKNRSTVEIVVEQFQFLSYRDPEKKQGKPAGIQGEDVTGKQQSFDDIPADSPFNDSDIPF